MPGRIYSVTFSTMGDGSRHVSRSLAIADSLAIYMIDETKKTVSEFAGHGGRPLCAQGGEKTVPGHGGRPLCARETFWPVAKPCAFWLLSVAKSASADRPGPVYLR